MKSLFFAVAIAMALAGCGSTGVQVSKDAALQFKEGLTKEAEILSKLGNPTTLMYVSGKKTLVYSGAQHQIKGATFIPIIGSFAGGADVKVTTASYQIRTDGVLERATYSTTGYSSRMGTTPTDMPAQEPTAIK